MDEKEVIEQAGCKRYDGKQMFDNPQSFEYMKQLDKLYPHIPDTMKFLIVRAYEVCGEDVIKEEMQKASQQMKQEKDEGIQAHH